MLDPVNRELVNAGGPANASTPDCVAACFVAARSTPDCVAACFIAAPTPDCVAACFIAANA